MSGARWRKKDGSLAVRLDDGRSFHDVAQEYVDTLLMEIFAAHSVLMRFGFPTSAMFVWLQSNNLGATSEVSVALMHNRSTYALLSVGELPNPEFNAPFLALWRSALPLLNALTDDAKNKIYEASSVRQGSVGIITYLMSRGLLEGGKAKWPPGSVTSQPRGVQ